MMLVCMPMGGAAWASEIVPLSEAVKSGVKVEFRSTGQTPTNISSYYGTCMQVRVHNASDSTLRLQLEPGLYLMPDEDPLQRMIILEDQIIVVAPRDKQMYNLAVMCTEKYDSAPGRYSGYSVGDFAPTKVVEMAEVINDENWYDFTGQSAMWAMHHPDVPLDYIHSEDQAKQAKLRFMVKRLREANGLPPIQDRVERAQSRLGQVRVGEVPDREDQEYVISKWKISIQGEFRYTLAESIMGTMQIFDETGEVVFTYFENQEIPAGERTFRFQFSTWTYDEADQFYLRLKDQTGTVVKERRISTDSE
ncbi:MAG TPA: hypothetical protein DCE41_04115 [Cytophagales bacterium]|nr:hypothetical protein [Cytophagales bacterium]